MRTIILTVATIAIATLLLVPAVSVYADTSLRMDGSQWALIHLSDSKILTSHADTIPGGGGVEFQFPDATATPPGFANLLTNGFTASLATTNILTANITVITTGSNMFIGNPDGSCPAASPTFCPGNVRLYFASNLPQAGMTSCLGFNGNSNHPVVANEFDFWWSNTPVQAFNGVPGSYYQFSPFGTGSGGTITLQVSLDPMNWSDLCGHAGTFDLSAFMGSIANIKDVGLSFGSGFFFENGVGVNGSTGSATFQLTSYTIS